MGSVCQPFEHAFHQPVAALRAEIEDLGALALQHLREVAAQLPLGHFGEPEDVAETVAFLASPAARLYVGQTLGPNSGDVML